MANSYIHPSSVSRGTAYDPDRENVRTLRMGGMDAEEIAGETGMPVDKVEGYCRQLGLPANGNCMPEGFTEEELAWLRYRQRAPANMRCPVCGELIRQSGPGRQKKFCSRQCKDMYWNGHKAEKEIALDQVLKCQNCGKEFYAKNSGQRSQRFCSRACYFEYRYGIREQ